MHPPDEIAELRALIAQLTQRVYRLERRLASGEEVSSSAPEPSADAPSLLVESAAAASPVAEISPDAPVDAPPFAASSAPSDAAPLAAPAKRAAMVPEQSLERRIGSQWLNRIGVVALLVGVSYFLKLAFDSGWIGPGVRVAMGCGGGVGLCLWSERFRRRDALAFSYSLKATGVGILYLSLWASFQLYHLLPGTIAFLAMCVVTAATAGVAIVQDAELLAGLALLGGVLTPVLCSSGRNQQAVLFSYLMLLSLAALALQRVKAWPRILFGAFLGSFLLAAGWFSQYYADEFFAETLLFSSLLFLLYAVAPLVVPPHSLKSEAHRSLVGALAVVNAAVYFFSIEEQWRIAASGETARLAGYAFGIAAFYLGLAVALRRQADEPFPAEGPGLASLHAVPAERLAMMIHQGLAVSFLTIGLALQIHQHWITLAWLVEGAVLFWAGTRSAQRAIQILSAAVLFLGVLRLLFVDLFAWHEQPLIFNPRLAAFAVAIAALLWTIYLDTRSEHAASDAPVLAASVVLVNLLALTAASLEIHDYFGALIRAAAPLAQHGAGTLHSSAQWNLVILRGFTYSALMMLYGAGLMWLGFARRSALLRWQAIVLIAVTILKVFLFDVSELERGWRVLSFLVLGVLLLAISYAYQRDWLRLQRPRSG